MIFANNAIPCDISKEEKSGYTSVTRCDSGPEMFRIRDNDVVRQMTQEEKNQYYPLSLDAVKLAKNSSIENKTEAIYAAGTPAHVGGTLYRFDTQTGKRAAMRWKTLDSVIWRVNSGLLPEAYMYPITIESITNAAGEYLKTSIQLSTDAAANAFYIELMQNDQAIATAGTNLLLLVEAATTVEEVNSIEDNRPIPYTP